MTSDSYLPFSQRTGLAPIPPQLKLGEVSPELRRLLFYFFDLEWQRESNSTYSYRVFDAGWLRVASDLHVLHFNLDASSFNSEASFTHAKIRQFIKQAPIGPLFDLVEFFASHRGCSDEFKRELASAFVMSRAAYRIFDNQYIVAIGTDEQAAAVERAITDAEAKNATAARKQLIAAGVALRNGDWSGCVRESIHAVEAMAVRLAPEKNTLGAALAVLDRQGHIHGSLRAAFDKLYGYSSNEEGVRHALVFGDEPKVDETDALFMLGACASFVSYLLARSE
jgi:hypothetical protein